ncbi:unnamed protein product [Candida verbasci]|uniref:Uncharacterized protein n=1 Tax=Candida verbasci TaxID=1227364 RepID=A0A9W4XC30_9ASCO|nr:unnamed protein product [Candida verbasci]
MDFLNHRYHPYHNISHNNLTNTTSAVDAVTILIPVWIILAVVAIILFLLLVTYGFASAILLMIKVFNNVKTKLSKSKSDTKLTTETYNCNDTTDLSSSITRVEVV